MAVQELRDYFSRHFLGRTKVNDFVVAIARPEVFSPKREVETHPVRTRMRVVGSTLFSLAGISCSSQGFRFASQLVRVKGAKIAKYVPGEIKIHTFSQLKTKTRTDVRRVAVLPQERANRLQWQSLRPKKEGEMILAWFGPIVEDAVVKLTLNKQHGTLLIWYNPQSRRFDSKGLYLYKRLNALGGRQDLEWRWL